MLQAARCARPVPGFGAVHQQVFKDLAGVPVILFQAPPAYLCMESLAQNLLSWGRPVGWLRFDRAIISHPESPVHCQT